MAEKKFFSRMFDIIFKYIGQNIYKVFQICSLNQLMLDRSIYFDFLQGESISANWRRRKIFRFRFIIFTIIVGMIKLFIHLQISPESNLKYYLNDACNPFGPAKKIGCTMFLLWAFSALSCGLYLLKIDKYSPKKAFNGQKLSKYLKTITFTI